MSDFDQAILTYPHKAVQWLRTRLFGKEVYERQTSRKFFKKGDLIETRNKRQGVVWRIVYKKSDDTEPAFCIVYLEDTKEILPFTFSAQDKSPKFNPLIRKVVEK